MMTGKSVKDVDRYQAVLNSLLALEENKFCADCESKGKVIADVLFPRMLLPMLGNDQCMIRLSLCSFTTLGNAALHSSSLDQLHCTMVQDTGATSSQGWSMGRQLHHASSPNNR